MEGSRLRLPEASQTPQGAASSAPPTFVVGGTFFSRINIRIQLFDYLFDLVLKLPINVQALLDSRDRRVDGRIFETAGKLCQQQSGVAGVQELQDERRRFQCCAVLSRERCSQQADERRPQFVVRLGAQVAPDFLGKFQAFG
jgi:hypothetical protein